MINPFLKIRELKKGCGKTHGTDFEFICLEDYENTCYVLCPDCKDKIATLIECRNFVKDKVNDIREDIETDDFGHIRRVKNIILKEILGISSEEKP